MVCVDMVQVKSLYNFTGNRARGAGQQSFAMKCINEVPDILSQCCSIDT